MNETKKSETCCGEPDTVRQTTSASEAVCCSPSHEASEIKESSVCCGPQVKSPRASGKRAEKSRLDIDFLYLDLSVCERCHDTESTLDEAIEEVAPVPETAGNCRTRLSPRGQS